SAPEKQLHYGKKQREPRLKPAPAITPFGIGHSSAPLLPNRVRLLPASVTVFRGTLLDTLCYVFRYALHGAPTRHVPHILSNSLSRRAVHCATNCVSRPTCILFQCAVSHLLSPFSRAATLWLLTQSHRPEFHPGCLATSLSSLSPCRRLCYLDRPRVL